MPTAFIESVARPCEAFRDPPTSLVIMKLWGLMEGGEYFWKIFFFKERVRKRNPRVPGFL